MNINRLRENWEKWGRSDPLWAILSYPDKRGGKWELEEFFESGRSNIREVMDYLNSLGVTVVRNRALDFGCGIGRLTQALSDYFDEVCGVDIAQSMIDLAEEHNRYPGKCRYFVNEADDLSIFETCSFDFIITWLTLQHMEPHYANKYLAEFLTLLSQGGLLIFQLPSHKRDESALRTPNPGAGLRQRIYQALPAPVEKAYRWFKADLLKRPIIEMYGIEKAKVVGFIKERGGKIIDIQEDTFWAGADWVSCTYYVSK